MRHPHRFEAVARYREAVRVSIDRYHLSVASTWRAYDRAIVSSDCAFALSLCWLQLKLELRQHSRDLEPYNV